MERKVVELNLSEVLPNRFQPRIKFSEDSINELAESIKEHGVIQPIIVRKIGDKYEIIAGERRFKASIMANKRTIPAIVLELNDEDSAEIAIIENVQRKDLTPIEEAISYKKILDMGYLTQDELANKLGKTQSTIANKLRLLNLDEEVQEALLNEQISERHARSLLRISDHKMQVQMLEKIIEERLTVRRTDEEIDKMLNGSGNDIEVLNFEGTNSVPEVFPKSNTDTPIESLNIPSTPIFEPPVEVFNEPTFNPDNFGMSEPKIEAVETLDIPNVPMNDIPFNNNQINPGFMDIQRIEEKAEEIYQPKPLADVDSLLTPTDILPDPMFEPQEIKSDEQTNDEGSNGMMTGKFFNIMPDENIEEKKPISPQPLDLTAFNFDLGINNLEQPATVSTPTVNQPSNNIDTINNLNTGLNPIQTNDSIPSFDFNFNNVNETPAVPPVIDNNPPLSFPQSDVPIPGIVNNIAAEDMRSSPPPATSLSNKVDLRNVIDMIRECSEGIERMGYIIETEEFDFEDMYQVIFKIDK